MNIILSTEGFTTKEKAQAASELAAKLHLAIGFSEALPTHPYIHITKHSLTIERLDYTMPGELKQIRDKAEKVILQIRKNKED